jgi:putative ABC transport system permease protein
MPGEENRVNEAIYRLSLLDLAWSFIPPAIVIAFFLRWSMGVSSALHGFVRMFIQLLVIGHALSYIFGARQPLIILAVLCVMLFAACMIAMRPVREKRRSLYLKALGAISAGGIFTLIIVTRAVIALDPWYEPRYLIPLAGMIFANAMNAVSIGAERFEAEYETTGSYQRSRATALRASLIPITNSLFAVGIVSLPGMMTGQILSGVSPLVAARYQIMVMCMVFGASGISAALYLLMVGKELGESSS